MGVESGRRLGPYEIGRPLGAGGMGEVYEALDTRLGRTVAVKVLPERLSGDPKFRQRFEREARAVSSLNHPHICTLHDIGSDQGIEYLVMERLEGETLSARLERGAMDREDALQVACQIADALDVAHRQGLIHRDLKPGNIMLTKAGAKVLDFGLAKMVPEPGSGRAPAMTAAPTMTSPLTVEGTVVGTFQYMAPEQLEGMEATARSDIFAFGAVLYEMLAGRRPFEGKTQASLVAAILKEEPVPLRTLLPGTSPALERLIETCLEKDPEERRQSIHDVLLELRWIRERGPAADSEPVAAGTRSGNSRLAWGLAVVATVAALALAALQFGPRTVQEQETLYLDLAPPEGTRFDITHGAMAVSPDGLSVAFIARDEDGRRHLWVRRLSSLAARRLNGTEGADSPFWSPDGRSLAFFAGGKIQRVPLDGGATDTIWSGVTRVYGGYWSPTGDILFTPARAVGIMRVPASGGTPEPLTETEPGHFGHYSPWQLPDGESLLFTRRTGTGNSIMAARSGGEVRQLMEGDSNALYVAPGHILFWRDGGLRTQPFDPDALELYGKPHLVVSGVAMDPSRLTGMFSASGGTLVYVKGSEADGQSRLVLRNRQGEEIGTVGPPGNYYAPRFSPDGRRVAVDNSGTANNGDIWIYDLDRPVGTRVTSDPADESAPVWSPDAEEIVFYSATSGDGDLFRHRLAGRGKPETLLDTDGIDENPTDWSRDGRTILYEREEAPGRDDIWILDLETGEERSLVTTSFSALHASFSPDGRFITYDSNESGQYEVYLRSIEPGGQVWQVSLEGGEVAFWREDGRELFFSGPDGFIHVVDVDLEGSVTLGTPRPLFRARMRFDRGTQYHVAPDGQTFVVNTPMEEKNPRSMSVVLNWSPEEGT